ncbi:MULTISPECIES: sigma-54 dependent transcriptional regulator [unclassified Stenotrophomonas]|uniref:sigma-54 interaction domain-containing protein n=1 Tax=unclassified Stenotrophomonas TaxID=196198 RepID=UPI00249AC38C|nr:MULTISPECIES: sigma-54 dependent transcriptional regulator [unclassified Stenotrophomonas]
MAAVPEIPARCVIWFGQPLAAERAALAAAGWQVRGVATDGAVAIGMRGNDLVVGLLDLRCVAAHHLPHLQAVLDQHRHLRVLAILPSGAAAVHPQWQPLLACCTETFSAPLDAARLVQRLQELGDEQHLQPPSGAQALIGESPVLQVTRAALRKFAPVELPVLITGETGTGKELAAHALHALSSRHARPFLAVNCGAIPAALVQSELFGHERGAFTGAASRRLGLFETASGGTVFLDEIGDLPLDAQTNLLRVLQEGTIERVGSNQPLAVDVRVIAATHVDLEQAVERGQFRRDLFYRLNVLRLPLPALRDRGSDITLLAEHFLASFRQRHVTRARGFSSEALQAMQQFRWPGNVRELLNRVQRAAIVSEAELITVADLELAPDAIEVPQRLLHDARQAAERDALLRALRQNDFNITACARTMQVSRVTVYRLCRKHQLALPELR